MKKIITRIICFLALLLVLAGIIKARATQPEPVITTPEPDPVELSVPSEEPSPEITPEPTPEPSPELFTISCVGDCTLWSNANYALHPAGYKETINGDFSYPFSNTVEYFANDDFTLANLECVLSDRQLPYDYTWATFYFLAPTEYTKIMLEGGVDFVNTANNHSVDFYQAGLDSTYAALEEYGLPFGKDFQSQIVTTESGLKIGIYTAGTYMRPDQKKDQIVAGVQDLKAQGAEYIICMFHWGEEMKYDVYDFQTDLAHACIDAGANLIYGSHSHMVQPVEEYNGAYIFYSLGNWTFGGNTAPKDPDTVIAQIKVKRDVDGTVSNDGFNTIPCCVSSKIDAAQKAELNYNDYRPTPYEVGSEPYNRVLSKLDGTFQPTSQGNVDYSAYYASRSG